MIYGEPDSFTYIIESMATGCAFFDFDNDGWMDIFIPAAAVWKTLRPRPATTFTKTTATAPSPT